MASDLAVMENEHEEEDTGVLTTPSLISPHNNSPPSEADEETGSQRGDEGDDVEGDRSPLFDSQAETEENPELPEQEQHKLDIDRSQLNYDQLLANFQEQDRQVHATRMRIRDLENGNAALRTQLQNTTLSNREIFRRVEAGNIDLTGWGTELDTLRDIVARRDARKGRSVDASAEAQEERESDMEDTIAQQQRQITELQTEQQANDGLVVVLNERIALEERRRGLGDVEQIDPESKILLDDIELDGRNSEELEASRSPTYAPPRTQSEVIVNIVRGLRRLGFSQTRIAELLPRVVSQLNSRIMQLWNSDPRRNVWQEENHRQAFLTGLSRIDPTYPGNRPPNLAQQAQNIANADPQQAQALAAVIQERDDARDELRALEADHFQLQSDFKVVEVDRDLIADDALTYFEDQLKRFVLSREDQTTLRVLRGTYRPRHEESGNFDDIIAAWRQFLEGLENRDVSKPGSNPPSSGHQQNEQSSQSQTGSKQPSLSSISNIPGLGVLPSQPTAAEEAAATLRRVTQERDAATARQMSLTADLQSCNNKVAGLLSELNTQNGTYDALSDDIRNVTKERDECNASVRQLILDLAQEKALLKGLRTREEVVQDQRIDFDTLMSRISAIVKSLNPTQGPFGGTPLEGLQLIRELLTRRAQLSMSENRVRAARLDERARSDQHLQGVVNEMVNSLNRRLGHPGQGLAESMEHETHRFTRLATQLYNQWRIQPTWDLGQLYGSGLASSGGHQDLTPGSASVSRHPVGQSQAPNTMVDVGTSAEGDSQQQGHGAEEQASTESQTELTSSNRVSNIQEVPSLEEIQAQLAAAATLRDAAVMELDELRNALENAEVDNGALQERKNNANRESQRLDETEKALADAQSERVTAEQERDTARTERNEANRERRELQTQLRQLQDDLQDRNDLLRAAQVALAPSTQILAERDNRIHELEEAVGQLQAHVLQLHAQVRQLGGWLPEDRNFIPENEDDGSGPGGASGGGERDGGNDGDNDGGDGDAQNDPGNNQGGINPDVPGPPAPPIIPSDQAPSTGPNPTPGPTKGGRRPRRGNSTPAAQPAVEVLQRNSRTTRNLAPNYGISTSRGSRGVKRKDPPAGDATERKPKKPTTGKGVATKTTKGRSGKKGGKKTKKGKADETYRQNKGDGGDDDDEEDTDDGEGVEEKEEGTATGKSPATKTSKAVSSEKGGKKTKKSKTDEAYKQSKDDEGDEDDEDMDDDEGVEEEEEGPATSSSGPAQKRTKKSKASKRNEGDTAYKQGKDAEENDEDDGEEE